MNRPACLLILFTLGVSHAHAQKAIETRSLDKPCLENIEPLVAAAIDKGEMPGCVVVIGRQHGIEYLRAFGQRAVEPVEEPMTTDTIFDLASLTKPIATATCAMTLVDEGRLRLMDKVADLVPGFAANGKEDITVEQLFLHTAGFVPDNPLADYKHGAGESWKRINALAPQSTPGERFKYSDVSFLVLGRVIEQVTGETLDQAVSRRVLSPLGMRDSGYNPAADLRERIAPTEKEDGVWLRGRVHDPRAALLDGVAGHAGLFSTAEDLALYARMMLGRGALNGQRVLSAAAVAEMTRPRDIAGQSRALGWDNKSDYSRNRGDLMSRRAFGHGGFTGTGIWIDPELDLFVVFLSSRLHPDGEGQVNDLIGRIGAIAVASTSAG